MLIRSKIFSCSNQSVRFYDNSYIKKLSLVLPEIEKIHLNSGADLPGTDEKSFKSDLENLLSNSPVHYKQLS